MTDMASEFEFVTTEAVVTTYKSTADIFQGLFREIRALSNKKPEVTMSPAQVKIVNRVLIEMLTFLQDDPEGKYLEKLDDSTLPRLSDAVLVMVQFETALESFKSRYYRYFEGSHYWITRELLAKWSAEDEETIEDEQQEDN